MKRKGEKMRLKKLAVFILVFMAVYGVITVDQAYSDMMDQDGMIAPVIKRVDPDHVNFSMLGQTAAVNTTELSSDWREISNKVTEGLDMAVVHIRDFLGIKEEERDYSVFKTQIL